MHDLCDAHDNDNEYEETTLMISTQHVEEEYAIH